MSENTPLTLTVELLSNAAWILCIIENSYVIHESPGRKSDSQVSKKFVTFKIIEEGIIDYPFKNFTKDGK